MNYLFVSDIKMIKHTMMIMMALQLTAVSLVSPKLIILS